MSSSEGLVARLRAEYLEMPGMRLTFQQVQRLCGVEPTLCKMALDALVEAKFLCVKTDGTYARLTDAEGTARPRSAKADLQPEIRSAKAS